MPFSRRPRPRRAATPSDAVKDIKAGLSELAEKLEQVFGADGDKSVSQQGSFELPIGDGKAQGVFGISVRMGLDGLNTQTFGNMKPGNAGPEVAETREPLVDVFEEDTRFLITVELPGVSQEEISVTAEEDIIRVETTGGRRYATEIALEGPVVTDEIPHTYQNGILEISVSRREA